MKRVLTLVIALLIATTALAFAEDIRLESYSDEELTALEQAFATEVIDHIRMQPLRDRLHYLIEKRFRGELNKCEGCRLCR